MDISDNRPPFSRTADADHSSADNVLPFPAPAGTIPAAHMQADPRASTPEFLSRHHPMRSVPLLDQLEQNWWALTSPQSIPRRLDVTAATLGPALATSFVATRIATGHARLRVVGRRISELVGSEARGMPLSCLMKPEARHILAERLEQVFDRPAIVDIPLHASRSIGRPALSGRLLLLPLADREGGLGPVRSALGALLIDGAHGGRPRRFEIDPDLDWRCDPISQPLRHPARFGARALGAFAGQSAPGPRLVVDNGDLRAGS